MIKTLPAALAFFLTSFALATEPNKTDAFLRPPEFRTPKLSPDGQSYGVVGVRDGRDFLAIVDLAAMQATPVATFTDLKLVNYWWKSSGAVLMLVENEWGHRSFRTFNLQTKKTNELYALNSAGGFVVNPLANDPQNILFSCYVGGGVDLRKLNLKTAKSTSLQSSIEGLNQWLTDRDGNALAGYGRLKDHWFMVFPDKSDSGWRRVDLGEKNLPDFFPVAVYTDQRRILGFDYASADTARVAIWDPVTDTKETIWQSGEIEPTGSVAWGDDFSNTRAVTFELDRPASHYLDPKDQQLAVQIDAALPETINSVVSTTADESTMIIMASSDVLPECFYLLNRQTGRLLPLGSAHPQIDPHKIAPTRYFSFAARDGRQIRGRIFFPPGTDGPLPAIIFAGASLRERSTYSFQPYIQLIASHGYATVEIDHRGVRGYGEKFAAAGDLQVAGTMGDDLVDGVRWLIKEGWIDQRRIAMLGQNTGGYLAIHTLARYPDIFCAWINLAMPMGVDSLEMAEVLFGRYSEKEMTARVGGKKAGQAYLQSLDPVPLLERVRVPSFHYYPRDPFDNTITFHGDRANRRLAKTGLPYTFIKGAAVTNFNDPSKNREQKAVAETARIYGELFDFLEKYVPVAPIPAAASK